MTWGLFVLTGPAFLIPHAQATLGESETSITQDQKAIPGARRSMVSRSHYSRHELNSEANTIRQYTNSDGVVFAITWSGISAPDLTPLLGNYAKEFRQSLRLKQSRPRHEGHEGRRSQRIHRGKRVVVERYGHMRAMRGIAYVPTLVPETVNVHELE